MSIDLKKNTLSSKLHKILSLAFTPLLLIFAVSGIGLNHPNLIQPLSLAVKSLPENYHFANWNRGSIQALVTDKKGGVYSAGKNGLAYFFQGQYQAIKNPLAEVNWHNFIYSLYLDEINNQLYVGSRDGLFRYATNNKQWHYYQETQDQRIVSLIEDVDNSQIIAIANHQLFAITADQVNKLDIQLSGSNQDVPLFRFIFALHSGEIWGLFGVLLMDLLAIALLYFSLSGLYHWLFPKFAKGKLLKRERKIKGGKLFRWLATHHNTLGLIFTPLLIISAATAMVMRPPGLLFIVSSSSPVNIYPSHGNDKIPYKITKAAMQSGQLILLTDDGVFSGSLTNNDLFEPIYFSVPVHGMGATVFQQQANGNLLVGSFSGLYSWQGSTNEFHSVDIKDNSKGLMPVAAYETPEGLVVFDYFRGKLFDEQQIFSDMPESYNDTADIALWNFLFELHNLRIFQHYIGPFYLLLLLVTSLALLIITITGTKRYLAKKSLAKRRQQALTE